MSCYMRHLVSLFETLGIEYDKANRKLVDTAIREALSIGGDAHCPEVWSTIKALSEQEREDLPALVAEKLG